RMIGDVVRISGEVQKISFKWLNRPHFHIKDETAAGIRVIMFTAPSNKIFVGDRVEAIGIVMKHLLTRSRLIISAVSVKRIEN
ncbi:MAG: nucleotide-binding protein, partial [Thermodesulfobacteriota bacterium]|nr:nucleotide-binding protein [Thermodesulfobacteriota bacterium]